MRSMTKKLLLSALGGALGILGILSTYNMISAQAPFYGIPAAIFIIAAIIAFWQAFN